MNWETQKSSIAEAIDARDSVRLGAALGVRNMHQYTFYRAHSLYSSLRRYSRDELDAIVAWSHDWSLTIDSNADIEGIKFAMQKLGETADCLHTAQKKLAA